MEKKLWEVIANQCAPVLADVKPSNLLILTSEEEEVFQQMEEFPHISSLCLYEGKNKSSHFPMRWVCFWDIRWEM